MNEPRFDKSCLKTNNKIIIMNKIIVLSLLLAFATVSSAQQATPKHWTETDYYKKSKHQKTAAWVFTAVGGTVLLTTLLVDAFTVAVSLGEGEATGTTLPYAIGGAMVGTGIVFFVASGRNRQKAKASVFINMEKAPLVQKQLVRNQSYPSAGIRISL